LSEKTLGFALALEEWSGFPESALHLHHETFGQGSG